MNIVLALPGALFVGFSLGLFGSGGSILTVPILVYVLGQEEKVAIASSLAIVGLVAMFGSMTYVRDRLIDWRTVMLFGGPGVAGTWLGAASAAHVSGTVQLMTFAVVMMMASWMMLRPPMLENTSKDENRPQRPTYQVVADGLLVGALTGFVGVGGGFLIVPALVLLGGLTMQRAIGTSLVIITLKSLAGYVKYLQVLTDQGLQVDLSVIAFFALAGVIGTFGGSAVACRLPQEILKKGFGVFLIIMALFILLKSSFS